MLAALLAACCAANGVPLRDPRNPSDPELFHDRTLPAWSEMVTIVLLKDAWMCTTPNETCLRSFFLKVFFLPFFSGAAAAPPAAAAGLAILVLSRWSFVVRRSQHHLLLQHRCWPTTDDQRPATWLCLCRRLLLIRDSTFTRAFAGARVRMSALSSDRQVAAMAVSAIGADFDE